MQWLRSGLFSIVFYQCEVWSFIAGSTVPRRSPRHPVGFAARPITGPQRFNGLDLIGCVYVPDPDSIHRDRCWITTDEAATLIELASIYDLFCFFALFDHTLTSTSPLRSRVIPRLPRSCSAVSLPNPSSRLVVAPLFLLDQ